MRTTHTFTPESHNMSFTPIHRRVVPPAYTCEGEVRTVSRVRAVVRAALKGCTTMQQRAEPGDAFVQVVLRGTTMDPDSDERAAAAAALKDDPVGYDLVVAASRVVTVVDDAASALTSE